MKIGYNETLDKNTLADDLELCSKYGYEYIEIRIDNLRKHLETHPIGELREYFRTGSVKPLSLNAIDGINFLTEEQKKNVFEDFTFACMMCKELSIPYIVAGSTHNDEMQFKSQEEIFKSSVEALRKLSDIASVFGAKVGFEPIGHKDWCVRSIKQSWEIVRAVDRENVGLVFDVFNLYAYAGLSDMEDIRDIPGDKIYILHINDSENHPTEELHPLRHRLLPGDGVMPLKEFLAALKATGYDDNASLELFNPIFENMEPEEVIKDGYIKTKAVLDMMA